MNSIGAKKAVSAPAKKGPLAPHVKHSGTGGVPISKLDVTGATDLGSGYVLVQLKTRKAGGEGAVARRISAAALLADNVPQIPSNEVKALLKKLAERGLGDLSSAPPKSPSQAQPELAQKPDENHAFMKKLAQQSLVDRARQVENGLLLTSADLCEQRQITRQALSRAVKDGRVFWLDGPSGMQLYPAFFAKPKNERLPFEKISRALGSIPGASKWQFFTGPKRSLGGLSPVEALGRGELESVMAAAVAFGER